MGYLVAVYDKRNLFMTEKKIFDEPKLEVVTFETDVGKFGLMTCFDAMYEHPFLDLVEEKVRTEKCRYSLFQLMWNICQKNITSLVFPTAWQSIPPHLTAVGFHSGLF